MMDTRCAAHVAALFMLCCAMLVAPARSEAADESAVIIDTERSLVLAGGNVHPSGPVPENLVAAGGRIVVDQPVGKGVVLAGGAIDLRAPIGGNVRAAGGSISIGGNVGGNVAAAGGEVRIAREATVAGAARIFSGTITIDGRVDGPLRASAERIIINGEVRGDVKAAAEEIVLGPGAKVGGSLQYASAKELVKGEGAMIGGAVTRREPHEAGRDAEEMLPRLSRGARIFGLVVSYLALLGCGALFLAAAPIFSVEAPDRIKSSPGRSLGMGLLALIGLPVLAVLFILTIIGIPVGGMLLALYPILLLLGFIVGTLFIANLAASLLKRPPPATIARAIGHYAIALAVVILIGRVPSAGGFFMFALIVLGMGAFAIESYRRMKGGPVSGAARLPSARPAGSTR
jgi:cytoskeletal protein CcmA (bactofilin family)